MRKDNIESFIPEYQQNQKFYLAHLATIAYGLEELNTQKTNSNDYSTPYQYIDALSNQSFAEGKIDVSEKEKVSSFSRIIGMLEQGATIPLREYKQGISDICDIISPQLREGNSKLEKLEERLTLDKAIGEIPYPLVGDNDRQELFADLIHRHNFPNIKIDKEGVLCDGKHFDEIGLNDLTGTKMVIYEYMEGLWERRPQEALESILSNQSISELGISEDMIDKMDMTRKGNYLSGNKMFEEVVRIISDKASEDYDKVLMDMVSKTLDLDKKISIDKVKPVDKFSVEMLDENNESTHKDVTKVKADISYQGKPYQIERYVIDVEDNQKMIFLDDSLPVKKNEDLVVAIKENFGPVNLTMSNQVDEKIETMLYSNTINEAIINKADEKELKKQLSSSLSM